MGEKLSALHSWRRHALRGSPGKTDCVDPTEQHLRAKQFAQKTASGKQTASLLVVRRLRPVRRRTRLQRYLESSTSRDRNCHAIDDGPTLSGWFGALTATWSNPAARKRELDHRQCVAQPGLT
jgi:hypothetical protein